MPAMLQVAHCSYVAMGHAVPPLRITRITAPPPVQVTLMAALEHARLPHAAAVDSAAAAVCGLLRARDPARFRFLAAPAAAAHPALGPRLLGPQAG